MTTPRTQAELDAITHHVDRANSAADRASDYLNAAYDAGHTPTEEERAIGYYRAALAVAAAKVADTHTRLLELKLGIGDTAL